MQDTGRARERRETLQLLLAALDGAKEYVPGSVNRRTLAALAAIPWITPELIAEPQMEPHARRIGLTAHVLERERRGALIDDVDHEKELLGDLAAMVSHTDPTPEDVVALLLFDRRPWLGKMLVEAEEKRASRIGKEAAAKRHEPNRAIHDRMWEMWAKGAHLTKKSCATAAEKLGYGKWQTLRNYLKGAPRPFPWPARTQATEARKKRRR